VTNLSLAGGQLLRADASAPEDRIREGRIVPWNEPGRTNLGLKRVHRGALKMTADAKVVGIYGHDQDRSVSRLISYEDRPDGMWGRWRISRTALGDQLLAEIDDGVRDGMSVELTEMEFDSAGDVIGGRLDFVAHVPVGAFDTARMARLAAALHTPSPTGDQLVTAPPAPAAPAAEPAPPVFDQAAFAREVAALLAPQLTAAAVPAGLPTDSLSLPSPGQAPSAGARPDADDPVDRWATLQAEVWRGTATPEMRAALADITNTGLDLFQAPSSQLGEKLWEGAGYARRFTRLMRNRPLTSWKGNGWQWVNRPRLQTYAGDKADVPTNTVSVTTAEWTASRLAGGWDIDRKFVDFGDAEFWRELGIATTESYLEESDLRAATALVSYALDITVDANVPAGYTTINVAQADVLRAVALGTAILEDTPRVRRGPDYVLMNTADWLGLVEITNLDVPAFLRLLKVAPENFERTAEVDPGTIVLGVAQAATFRELSGTPIRVSAQNIPQGGVDEACFGYTATHMDRPGGIISVPLVPAG
jgi:hypothetical protein